jgi:branched-chain amino acid transport system permease protein
MKYIPWIIVVVIIALCPVVITSYGLSLLIQVLIFGILAMSLNVLVGYTGLLSFNHATFFGVSAYAAGILFIGGTQSFWLTLSAGIIAAMLLAALLGLIILRSIGSYFFMLTLAFGQMVFAIAWKWRSFTGGDDGLPGISRPEIGLGISLWNNKNFYYLVIIIFILVVLFLRKLIRLPFGRAMVGVRENEPRMQALGYNTWLIKYMAYVLAAGLAAVAGVLHVYYNGFISPHELNWTTSGMVMLMVIIGGAGTIIGPAIGAGIIIILQNWLSSYTERWPLVIGAIFIICVMYARDGIAGRFPDLKEKGRRCYENLRNKKYK